MKRTPADSVPRREADGGGGTPDRRPRVVATVALVFALGVNALANWLPLGGRTTGELSALYPNLFVPTGATFSIWGVIYLLVVGWAVMQFRPSNAALGNRIAPWFTVSSLLNGGWLLAWHYEQVELSMAVMLGLLGVLIALNDKIHPDRRRGPVGILPRAAFGVYLGWILVAALVNGTALLVAWEWGGWGLPDAAWAMILIGVGTVAAIFTLRALRNPWLGLAVLWAFGGIAFNRWDDVASIAWMAVAAGVIVAAATLHLGFQEASDRSSPAADRGSW